MKGNQLILRALSLLTFVSVILAASDLAAYNFLHTHPTTGEPIGWESGTTIQYYLDPGPLGRLTNDQAYTLLKEAMKIWENASPNANVPKFEFAGYLSEDVNGENYAPYVTLFPCHTDDLEACPTEAQKELKTVIIFDEDDSILDNELCKITSCTASSGARVFSGNSSDPKRIVQGIFVIGSAWGRELAAINEIVGLMVHELGHLLGLAHTSVNQQIILAEDIASDQWELMPSLFHESGDKNYRSTLHPDDIAGIAALYPSAGFESETATIKGEIFKSDNSPMMHVNVIARNVDDPLCEAYSFVSGRLCEHTEIGQYCLEEDGNFSISALPPGSYTIEVEEVADDSLALTLAPSLLPDEDIFGDAEFWNEGDAPAEDHLTSTAIALAPGETRENVDIILNRSEVTEDRIKFLPLDTFTPGPGTRCPEEPPVNYAQMIGIEESDYDPPPVKSTGGCSLGVR